MINSGASSQDGAPASRAATFSCTGNASGISGVMSDGNNRATLLGAGITNHGGTPPLQDHIFNLFFLNGDANHDADVDLDDFNILAGRFGTSISPVAFGAARTPSTGRQGLLKELLTEIL